MPWFTLPEHGEFGYSRDKMLEDVVFKDGTIEMMGVEMKPEDMRTDLGFILIFDFVWCWDEGTEVLRQNAWELFPSLLLEVPPEYDVYSTHRQWLKMKYRFDLVTLR